MEGEYDDMDASLDALEAAVSMHSTSTKSSSGIDAAKPQAVEEEIAQQETSEAAIHSQGGASNALEHPITTSPSKSPQPLGAATQQELGSLLSAAVHSPGSPASMASPAVWAPHSLTASTAASSSDNSPLAQDIARKAQAALASAASSPLVPSDVEASPPAHLAAPLHVSDSPPQYLQDTASALYALQAEHSASPQGSLQSDALFEVSPASLQAPPRAQGGATRPGIQRRLAHVTGLPPQDASSEVSETSDQGSLFREHEFRSPGASRSGTGNADQEVDDSHRAGATEADDGTPQAKVAAEMVHTLDVSVLSTAMSAADRSFASHQSRASTAARRAHRSDAQLVHLQQELAEANAYIAELQRAVTSAEQASEHAQRSSASAESAAKQDALQAKQRAQQATTAAQEQMEEMKNQLHATQESELRARREVHLLQVAARRQAAAAASKPPEKESGPNGALQQCKQQLEAARTALATAKAVHQKAQTQWSKQEALQKQFAQQAGSAKNAAEAEKRAAEKRAVTAETRAAGLQKQMAALQRRAETQEQRLGEVPSLAALQTQLRQLHTHNTQLQEQLLAAEQAGVAEPPVDSTHDGAEDSSAETRRLASEVSSLRSQRQRLLARCHEAQANAQDAAAAAELLKAARGSARWLAARAGIAVPEQLPGQSLAEMGEEIQHLLREAAAALRAAHMEAQAAAADATASRAHAHAATVEVEMLRGQLERAQAMGGSHGGAFGEPASAADMASGDEYARLQERLADAQEQLTAQHAKTEHATRKLASQELLCDTLRNRVAELMAKAEARAQRNAAAFERVFGRAPRGGSLVDAAPLQLTAAYEAKLQAAQEELADARAMLAELQGSNVRGPLTQPPSPPAPSTKGGAKEGQPAVQEKSTVQLPPASPESMLATPHAHAELLKQRAAVQQLRNTLAHAQSQLAAAQAHKNQLGSELQDLRQLHDAAIARSTASIDKLQGELHSRPSAKEWMAARRRLVAVEGELQAAAEAGFDRAVLQLRAQQSERESVAAAQLQRPGVQAVQDRTAHALHGLAPRLRAMPRDAANAVLQELCSELQVEDPSASPGAVRTLKAAVAFLPVLDAVVSQVAAVGVTARVATGAVQGQLCSLLEAVGVDSAHFMRGMAEAAELARQPAPVLPSTVASAVQYLQGAVQHVLMLPLLCRLVEEAAEAVHSRHGGHATAMASAFDEGCAAALKEAATSPPPVLASEPGMAAWLHSHISSSSGQAVGTATNALQGALQELVASEAEHSLIVQAFHRVDESLTGLSSEQRAEQAVLLHFMRALGVSQARECVPALAKLLNSSSAGSDHQAC